MQGIHGTHLLGAAQLEQGQSAPLLLLRRRLRLDPAEYILDPAAGVERFGVAPVAGDVAVDRGPQARLVRRDPLHCAMRIGGHAAAA